MMKITLVTVTYNATQVLGRTLESVFSQKYSSVEHIIIDGASSDGTAAMAQDYLERTLASDTGHEAKLLVEPDDGIYHAMNKGLSLATGDYVCFLNAGDALPSEDTLAELAECVAANTGDGEELPAVVYGNTDIVDGEGQFLCHRRLQPPAELSWRSFRHGMLVCHQAFYVRADIARAVHYNTTYRYSSDFDWCIRIMRKAENCRLRLLNSHLLLALYLKEGTTTRHHRASLRERFRIMSEYYGTLPTALRHVWFALRSIAAKDA